MLARIETWIRSFLQRLNVSRVEERTAALMQFVRFSIVGGSSTVVNYLLNVLTLLLLKPYDLSWDYVAGNMVAFVLSVLWSFYWNNRFVFRKADGQERSVPRTLLRTFLVYGFTGIVLSNLFSTLWIHVLGISKVIAPLLNLFINVPVNYIVNKKWAYR